MEFKNHARVESDRSSDEKNMGEVANAMPVNLPEDPDAHLSDAQRKEIVSS